MLKYTKYYVVHRALFITFIKFSLPSLVVDKSNSTCTETSGPLQAEPDISADSHRLSVRVVSPGYHSTVVEEELVGIVGPVGEVGILEQPVVAALEDVVEEIPVVVVVRIAVLQVILREQERSILGDIVRREERSCILWLRVGVDLEGLGMRMELSVQVDPEAHTEPSPEKSYSSSNFYPWCWLSTAISEYC